MIRAIDGPPPANQSAQPGGWLEHCGGASVKVGKTTPGSWEPANSASSLWEFLPSCPWPAALALPLLPLLHQHPPAKSEAARNFSRPPGTPQLLFFFISFLESHTPPRFNVYPHRLLISFGS